MRKIRGTFNAWLGHLFWQEWRGQMGETSKHFNAVFGWCWCGVLGEWQYRLLYWKLRPTRRRLIPQVQAPRRLFYSAGFVLTGRGRHDVYNFNSGRWF